MEKHNFLFLTGHDFRTPRKASMHFIARELAKRGKVRFFSLRYSWLSKKRPDGRHVIASRANKIETVDGVDCFLWKTLVHPLNTRRPYLRPLETLAFKLYALMAPPVMKRWIKDADTIFFESGTAVVFFDLACRLNPRAKKVYIASDELDVINVAQYIKDTVYRISTLVDYSRLHSRLTIADFAPGAKLYFVAQGIDPSIGNYGDPSPFGPGAHAVSVGSMLFDAGFVETASALFPDVTFHIIGCGRQRPPAWPSNVIVYDEMKFEKTVPYIKHASLCLAPYLTKSIPRYLADTSLKLTQYEFFGVPAVCPFEVVGGRRLRFGYKPGDGESIASAIRAALKNGHAAGVRGLTWEEVADRLLDPKSYPETSMEGWDSPKDTRN